MHTVQQKLQSAQIMSRAQSKCHYSPYLAFTMTVTYFHNIPIFYTLCKRNKKVTYSRIPFIPELIFSRTNVTPPSGPIISILFRSSKFLHIRLNLTSLFLSQTSSGSSSYGVFLSNDTTPLFIV